MNWTGLLEGARQVISAIMHLVAVPVLIYFVVINTSLLVLIGLAAAEFSRQRRIEEYAGREETVPMTTRHQSRNSTRLPRFMM